MEGVEGANAEGLPLVGALLIRAYQPCAAVRDGAAGWQRGTGAKWIAKAERTHDSEPSPWPPLRPPSPPSHNSEEAKLVL